jgi:predicted secreted hydrolase
VLKRGIIFIFIFLVLFLAEGWGMEFKTAQPGYSFHFPADHGSHDDYQIEWWYFTGHLVGNKGHQAGFELTFFRTGLGKDSIRKNPSRWHVENIYSAHFAISNESEKAFWFREKMGRNGLGNGGAEPDRFKVWIDRWSGREKGGVFHLSASEGSGTNQKGIELNLVPEKPVVIHGENGASPKDSGSRNRSHYYSLTRLKTSGTFIWNGEVEEVEGISWMDHEFGSNPLLPFQVGWDWFSIQLNNGIELMLYQIRNQDGSPPFSFGTLIDAAGSGTPLQQKDFIIKPAGKWKSPAGPVYPAGWEISLPGRNFALTLSPSFQNQELSVFGGKMKYWEGSVSVTGLPSPGKGYVELTGYASDFSSLFSQNGQ